MAFTVKKLIDAAERGDEGTVLRCLREGVDIDGTDDCFHSGGSALFFAVKNKHDTIVKTLLENGANPNKRQSADAITPLMRASLDGRMEIVTLLIDKGAKVNDCTGEGFTALMWASLHDRKDVVEQLIRKGADVNARNNNNFTSLHYASISNYMDVARILLANGAEINVMNIAGETALDCAKRQNPNLETAKLLSVMENEELVVAMKAKVLWLTERVNHLENENVFKSSQIEALSENLKTKERQLAELKTLLEENITRH